MADKYFLKNEDDQYGGGVLLDEYNNRWSLVSAREGNDGTVYMQWAFPQGSDRKPRAKAVPWKVTFGNKGATIKALQYFLGLLGNDEPAPF